MTTDVCSELPALRLHHLHVQDTRRPGFGVRPEPLAESAVPAVLLESRPRARPGTFGIDLAHNITERPDLAAVVGCLPVRIDARGRQLVVLNEECTAELLSFRVCLVEVRSGLDRDTGCPLVAVQAPKQFGITCGGRDGIWLITIAAAGMGVQKVLGALSALGAIRTDFPTAYHLDPKVVGAGANSDIHRVVERTAAEMDADQDGHEIDTFTCPADVLQAPGSALNSGLRVLASRFFREGRRGCARAPAEGVAVPTTASVCELHGAAPFSARSLLPAALEDEVFILSAVQGHPCVSRLHGLFFMPSERPATGSYADEPPIVASCTGVGSDSLRPAGPPKAKDPPMWTLVTDYYTRGNLYRCLGRVPSETRVQDIMQGVLSALHHIHDRGVIHRDVKVEHLFLTELGHPVLADFETACWADDRRETCRRVGTLGYMAPEMYMERFYNEKVDVFAAGVVMFYSLSRVLPFLGGSSASTQRRTCHLEIDLQRYGVFECLSDTCKDLLMWLLVKSPHGRPHADEALDHGWFNPNYDTETPEADQPCGTASKGDSGDKGGQPAPQENTQAAGGAEAAPAPSGDGSAPAAAAEAPAGGAATHAVDAADAAGGDTAGANQAAAPACVTSASAPASAADEAAGPGAGETAAPVEAGAAPADAAAGAEAAQVAAAAAGDSPEQADCPPRTAGDEDAGGDSGGSGDAVPPRTTRDGAGERGDADGVDAGIGPLAADADGAEGQPQQRDSVPVSDVGSWDVEVARMSWQEAQETAQDAQEIQRDEGDPADEGEVLRGESMRNEPSYEGVVPVYRRIIPDNPADPQDSFRIGVGASVVAALVPEALLMASLRRDPWADERFAALRDQLDRRIPEDASEDGTAAIATGPPASGAVATAASTSALPTFMAPPTPDLMAAVLSAGGAGPAGSAAVAAAAATAVAAAALHQAAASAAGAVDAGSGCERPTPPPRLIPTPPAVPLDDDDSRPRGGLLARARRMVLPSQTGAPAAESEPEAQAGDATR